MAILERYSEGETAMRNRKALRTGWILIAIVAATLGVQALRTEAASARHCPRGIRACTASQVGQPCDPNNLNVLCSAQANGMYCCLAYAP